ncbi:hypothetical protein AB1K32_24635 [Metabacillus dongyingensis]|uniref:hypothetical protein n=1 Tax=Metabacillus dongyingensis TaxID=2874282 RepID=UPI003B8D4B3B
MPIIKDIQLLVPADMDQNRLFYKLEFADDRFTNVYRLTFLEKDEPDQLVWKIKKLTVN